MYGQMKMSHSIHIYLTLKLILNSLKWLVTINSTISISPPLQSIQKGVFHYERNEKVHWWYVNLKIGWLSHHFSLLRILSSTILKDFRLLTVSPFLSGHWPNSPGWICIINRVNGSIYLFVLSDFSVNLLKRKK